MEIIPMYGPPPKTLASQPELFSKLRQLFCETDPADPKLQSRVQIMGVKRKAPGAINSSRNRPDKKSKSVTTHPTKKETLIFDPRADWHAVQLPSLPSQDVKTAPPQHLIDEIHKYATQLLEAENAAYNASHMSGSSSHKFMSTIMSSGTIEDKISALTLLVQESPLHTMKGFENLVGMCRKKSRNQAMMALAALKDLLGQGVVLPADRKLCAFGKQPGLLSALQGTIARWRVGDALPSGLQKVHLIVWAFEDWLKRTFFELLQILEGWCNDEVEYARSRAITYVWELLRDKPEQEENLLRLLVNKLGDNDKKIASRASYLLLQLENSHPAMKLVITNSIESECLFRPGQSAHAKYYAIITLNQTIITQKDDALANRLLEIYFALFVQFLKPKKSDQSTGNKPPSKVQNGGGKAGKMAAKKQKALERTAEAEVQLNEKVVAQVLTGVNRAFPFADTNTSAFEKQMDTIFRVTHSSNFNTSIQALTLIQQISTTKHYGADRFYRTLYESLLDPRLVTSSKQIMYLNLLYKSLKADLNAKRVQAFIKRLLQIIALHEPPFVCGVLYLISELSGNFPSILRMVTEPEYDEDDEEEHYSDVADDAVPTTITKIEEDEVNRIKYDPRKRDPEHAHAERSCLWELVPFLQHFHPSVALFAQALITQTGMPPKPDPTQHSLMHFLDRFVYRNAKAKPAATHGSSIMQPLGGSTSADLLVKPGARTRATVSVNTENFWRKKLEDVAVDEVFFHAYFNQAGGKKSRTERRAAVHADDMDDSDADDLGEEEIWQAIAKSKPEVEGAESDEDDDLSLGDLESTYSDSDAGSEGGIDLGGEGEDDVDGDVSGGVALDDEDFDEDAMPNFDSDEDEAYLDDEDEVSVDFSDEDDTQVKAESKTVKSNKERNAEKKRSKKKLKSLPTFASAEDYAKLLDAEPDDL